MVVVRVVFSALIVELALELKAVVDIMSEVVVVKSIETGYHTTISCVMLIYIIHFIMLLLHKSKILLLLSKPYFA